MALQAVARLMIATTRTRGGRAAMARLMIDSVDQSPAPRRITLGSDAYTILHKALSERLALLETQRDLAFSTDLPAGS